VLLIGLAAWIGYVTLTIWRTPPRGEPTVERLATAVESALAGDAGRLTRLMPENTDPDAVERFAAAADCGPDGSAVAVVRDGERNYYLQFTGPSGERCGRVAVAEADGRWIVDPWARPVR
jgi:hypothetical protein